ncbi:MAG: FtsX-like permease family protein [Actinomycetota bacterium]
MSWKLSETAAEGIRNLVSAPQRAVGTFALTALLLGALVFTEAAMASALIRHEEGLTEAGGGVVVVSQSRPGLEAHACAQIAGFSGVRAAGPILDRGAAPVTSAGGGLVARWYAAGSALDVLLPGSNFTANEGYAAGEVVAARLGLVKGSTVQFGDERPEQVYAVLPMSGRFDDANTAMIAESWIVFSDRCVIEVEHRSLEVGREIAASRFGSGEDTSIRPLLPQSEFERDTLSELNSRPQRWSWLVAAGVILLAIAAQRHARRAEIAVYQAHGAKRPGLALAAAAEYGPQVVMGATVGLLWGIGVAYVVFGTDVPIEFATRLPIAAAILALAGTPLIGLATGSADIAEQLKDR